MLGVDRSRAWSPRVPFLLRKGLKTNRSVGPGLDGWPVWIRNVVRGCGAAGLTGSVGRWGIEYES